jgi:phosphatidylglycerol lysyltransferase
MKIPDAVRYYPASARMPPELQERMREFAYRYGDTYASYLSADDGLDTVWSRDGRGVIRFARWGGCYCIVVGGLLAPPDDQPALLDGFLRLAKLNRWHVSFYNIDRQNLPLFRRFGLEVTKFGEDPVVRLDKATWEGKDYEWIRRQENYCRRQGVRLFEVSPNPHDPLYRRQIAPELEAISREHIAATLHGRELRWFVGSFDAYRLGRRRLFVAMRDSRIEAFVVCNPCLDGAMWAVESYRRRADAPRGVMPFAILQVMRALKREGVAYCSLSLIPLVRCETAVKGDSPIARTALVFLWRHMNSIFDFRGIYHFKSRFRPEYREMYMVAWPRVTVRSMIALGMGWGLLKLNPWRLVQRALGKSQKLDSRRSLAEPDYRPSKILRRFTRSSPPAEAHPAVPPPCGEQLAGKPSQRVRAET